MPPIIDETHDPNLESWVESANEPGADFPIQNLPYCVFARDEGDAAGVFLEASVGVAIGDCVLDLEVCAEAGLLDDLSDDAMTMTPVLLGSIEGIAHESAATRRALRRRISDLLRQDNAELRDSPRLRRRGVVKLADVELLPPCEVGDYTDFYCSVHHATNVGSMFRPDNPLLPNYKHIPIGYHGRASSIVASGTPIARPSGQQAPAEEGGAPTFGPCKLLDYELELGAFLGPGNELGEAISIEEAEANLVGVCLVNDWSARDIQKWEYQPLGPFLAKSFATTVAPFVVSAEALAPFRCAAELRAAGDPKPLPYLFSEENQAHGGIDLTLEVHLASAQMHEKGMAPMRLSRGSFRTMYWTLAQMVAHHSSNGCNLRPGDLIASGTVSGPERESRGCLLELTWDGDKDHPVPGNQRTPIELPTGETRTFLQDGDEVILTGYAEREGFRRIGLGECRGVVV